jgi:hypothetical protein
LRSVSAARQPSASPLQPRRARRGIAARTLEQNRRVVLERPTSAPAAHGSVVEPGSSAGDRIASDRIASSAAVTPGRIGLAAGGNPGVPR